MLWNPKPPELCAGFALIKMAGGVGSFVGPSLIGALSDSSDGSCTAAVLLLAAFLVIASAMQLLFREPGAQLHTIQNAWASRVA